MLYHAHFRSTKGCASPTARSRSPPEMLSQNPGVPSIGWYVQISATKTPRNNRKPNKRNMNMYLRRRWWQPLGLARRSQHPDHEWWFPGQSNLFTESEPSLSFEQSRYGSMTAECVSFGWSVTNLFISGSWDGNEAIAQSLILFPIMSPHLTALPRDTTAQPWPRHIIMRKWRQLGNYLCVIRIAKTQHIDSQARLSAAFQLELARPSHNMIRGVSL